MTGTTPDALDSAVEALLDSWHLNGPARDRLRDQARGRLARGQGQGTPKQAKRPRHRNVWCCSTAGCGWEGTAYARWERHADEAGHHRCHITTRPMAPQAEQRMEHR